MTGKTGTVISIGDGKFNVRVDCADRSDSKEETTELMVGKHFDQIEVLSGSSASPLMRAVTPHTLKRRRSSKKLVGRYVVIEKGRYKGSTGYVTKGGNGYFSVQVGVQLPILPSITVGSGQRTQLPPPPEGDFTCSTVMKRSTDLSLVAVLGKEAEHGDRCIDEHVDSSSDDEDASVSESFCSQPEPVNSQALGPNKYGSKLDTTVVIKTGKYRGEMGMVTKSGHGFYRVQVPTGLQIMKRSHELEFTDSLESDDEIPVEPIEWNKLRGAASILLDLLQDYRNSPFMSTKRLRENYLDDTGDLILKKPSLMTAKTEDQQDEANDIFSSPIRGTMEKKNTLAATFSCAISELEKESVIENAAQALYGDPSAVDDRQRLSSGPTFPPTSSVYITNDYAVTKSIGHTTYGHSVSAC